MPQARLPDINTAFNYHRGKAETHWQARNYTAAIGSLYAFNSLLPKDYQIKISTKAYNEKTNQDLSVICNACNQESKYQDIRIYDSMNDSISLLITGNKYDKVWNCNQCHKVNKLSKTKMIQNLLAKPSFIKIISEPPERKDGLQNRHTYPKDFNKWFWQFLDELEASAAKFRDDNWQKEDHIGSEDINTDDEIEEPAV